MQISTGGKMYIQRGEQRNIRESAAFRATRRAEGGGETIGAFFSRSSSAFATVKYRIMRKLRVHTYYSNLAD